MKDKIYREVSVTDRLPQTSGSYLTNNGKRIFSDHINVWQQKDNEGPVEWWMEVVSLDHIKDKRELTATFLVNSIRLLDDQGARHLVKELCERFNLFPSDEEVFNQTLFNGIDASVFFEKGVDWIINKLKGVKDE